jgi:hypothetical protein
MNLTGMLPSLEHNVAFIVRFNLALKYSAEGGSRRHRRACGMPISFVSFFTIEPQSPTRCRTSPDSFISHEFAIARPRYTSNDELARVSLMRLVSGAGEVP